MQKLISRGHRVNFDLLGNHPIVIDGGVCGGDFTWFIASKLPGSKMFGYEPCKRNIKTISARFNGHKNINVFNKAITGVGYPRSIVFNDYLGFSDNGRGSVFSKQDDDRFPNFTNIVSYEIDTTTIKDIIKDNVIDEIDFLKLDVECAEHDIIHTMDDETLFKIHQISMEVHVIPGDSRTWDELKDALEYKLNSCGFTTTIYPKEHELYGVRR